MSRRKLTIKDIELTDLDPKAFRKVLAQYYKSKYDLELTFIDESLHKKADVIYGSQQFCDQAKKHIIKINVTRCKYISSYLIHNMNRKTVKGKTHTLNKRETLFRIFHTLLHEIRHAHQHDKDPDGYTEAPGKNEYIFNTRLGYEMCPYEADAEGWALMNINKAMERYFNAVQE